MHFVGLDLAWGPRNASGIAVLDAAGELVLADDAVTDVQIQRMMAPYLEGPCLLAVDAPLIVNNSTGMRRAESEFNADFRKFEAGAHSANTGMVMFNPAPRGARLAEYFGLSMDPFSGAPRRAIEIYPHPATIALFRLGRTLKYKAGRGRSVDDRKSAMLELVRLIESLAAGSPPMRVARSEHWMRLSAAVHNATRHVDLNKAEDPIDAVLCAYIALYATRRPSDIVVYGDFHDGYILTPALPADLEPVRRNRSTRVEGVPSRVTIIR